MGFYIGNKKVKKIYLGVKKVKKVYLGDKKIYSSGNMVTYMINSKEIYFEEVEEGADVLGPTSFSPQLSGWEFIGWRKDAISSPQVLSELAMGDNPITLYAVFRKAVTLTVYNGSTTASSQMGYRYNNQGSIINPRFTISANTISGWNFRGWCSASSATGTVAYGSINNREFSADTTLYGKYSQTITLAYKGDGLSTATATKTGTRYFNTGNYSNPKFTVPATAVSGWSFSGWCSEPGAAAAVTYASISGREFTANATVYAKYSQTITLSYNGNGGAGITAEQSGTRYHNTGNYNNPSFSFRPNGYVRNYFAFHGWLIGNAMYQPGGVAQLSANTIAYAGWRAASLALSTTDRCTPVTGGWMCRIDWNPEIDADYSGMVGAIVAGSGGRINLYTKNPIDFTYINSIDINVETGYCGGHFYAGISSDPHADGVEAGIDLDYKLDGMVRKTVDVSGVTGNKYFKIVMYPNNHCHMIVENITCS